MSFENMPSDAADHIRLFIKKLVSSNRQNRWKTIFSMKPGKWDALSASDCNQPESADWNTSINHTIQKHGLEEYLHTDAFVSRIGHGADDEIGVLKKSMFEALSGEDSENVCIISIIPGNLAISYGHSNEFRLCKKQGSSGICVGRLAFGCHLIDRVSYWHRVIDYWHGKRAAVIGSRSATEKPIVHPAKVNPGKVEVGKEFSAEETRQIGAFLKSLTGDQPILPPSSDTTPRPNPWGDQDLPLLLRCTSSAVEVDVTVELLCPTPDRSGKALIDREPVQIPEYCV